VGEAYFILYENWKLLKMTFIKLVTIQLQIIFKQMLENQ
tara:strand:+ start:11478 stop:11594 length:117 start_codon:yes stop_codon:yes gene_type:complete